VVAEISQFIVRLGRFMCIPTEMLPVQDCPLCCEQVLQLRLPRARLSSTLLLQPGQVFILFFHRNECSGSCRCCTSCWRRYLRSSEPELLHRMRHARSNAVVRCWVATLL